MHIPEKYRDRYDRLALNHPWMREMRDETETIGDLIEQHIAKNAKREEAVKRLRKGESNKIEWLILGDDCPSWVFYDTLTYNKKVRERIADLLEDGATEPTNGIYGGTNGIADDSPLVDGLPEGDAVEILRKWANFWGVSHSTHTQCDSNWEKTTMRTLADMVERDYVRRDSYDPWIETKEHIARLEAERDELKRKLEIADRHEFESDQACDECKEHTDEHLAEIIAERDELKDKLDSEGSWKQAFEGLQLIASKLEVCVRELTAERDEWKAKCEQAMESYADAKDARDTWHERYMALEGSSKVRAGQSNLEWLFEHDYETLCDQMGGQPCSCCVVGCESDLGSDEACSNALREWLMAPHEDVHSKAQSTTGPSLSEQSESLSDENTPETPDLVENPRKTGEQGQKDDEFADSREKLEAEIDDWCAEHFNSSFSGKAFNLMLRWLNRQVAITKRELCKQCEWPSLAAQPDQEAYDRIAELTAKVDEQSEIIAARGKTIETLEHMLAEKRAKYREVREKMLDYQRKLKAERDEYRELYEAAMFTDYAQVARERDELRTKYDQIRSIIDETPNDGLADE